MDSSDGAHRRLKGPPVCVPLVFTLLQQVLAAPVVRLLVEDPRSILDMSRVDVSVPPSLLKIGQVFAHFDHLPAEVWTLVDTDPVSTIGLKQED